MNRASTILAAAALACCAEARSATVSLGAPDMDVYMYANAFGRGTAPRAATFGGPTGSEGVGNEDRLAQAIYAWDTAASGIPAGLGLVSYSISRITVKFTRDDFDGFFLAYDPTYDGYRTYLPLGDAGYLPDADAGRPMELYGVGLRNGYTGLAVSAGLSGTRWGESSPYGPGGAEHTRHAFAYSPTAPRMDGDVSENVTEGFEAKPFAIGQIEGLSAGDEIPADATFTFELTLEDPAILAYFQKALNDGALGVTLSSMHESTFNGTGGTGAFPRFGTREGVPFVQPDLEIEYLIVPEPSVGQVFIVGAALLASVRAVRRRRNFS